jgi:hypothetical protein
MLTMTDWIRVRRLGRVLFALVAVSAASLFVPAHSSAQVAPADAAAVLLRTALEFEARGEWDLAEALFVHITERYPGTVAAEQALERLTRPAAERPDRESRLELPVFGTLYGLWLGVAVPAALGADSNEAYGAGLLAGVPIGLLSALAAQRSQQYSEGQARAITWGGIWGSWQGLGWSEVLGIGQEEVCSEFGCFETDDNSEEVLASMIFGGLAGIATGAVIARNPVRSGVSSAAQGGSTWGSIYGAMLAEMFDSDDGGDGDGVLLTSLLLGNAGLLAGELLGSAYDVSRPRVRLMNLGALGGGLVGLGIDLLAEPGDNAAIAIPLASSVAGLAIATVATRGREGVRGGAPGGGDDMALLGYTDGGWRVGAPMPIPTALPIDRDDGRIDWVPGLRLELFRARF